MSKIKIHTAQNVIIEYELASIGDRIGAYFLDFLVLCAYVFLLVGIIFGLKIEDSLPSAVWFIFLLPILFYDLFCELFLEGQSIGKRALEIKVIKINGSQPTFLSYFLRWVTRPLEVSMTFFLGVIGVISILVTDNNQRLGDLLAGTCVVKIKDLSARSVYDFGVADLAQHEIVFSQIANLTDKDVAIIRQVLEQYRENGHWENVKLTSQKVKEFLKIEDEKYSDLDFLKTIVKDYQSYTSNDKF